MKTTLWTSDQSCEGQDTSCQEPHHPGNDAGAGGSSTCSKQGKLNHDFIDQ